MQVKVLLPRTILVDEVGVRKLSAEAENGSFTILPRHIDFLSALVPGLLFFESENGKETFMAIDEGILVKRGDVVRVSVRQAVRSDDLESLRETVEREFRDLSEHERQARSMLAALETDLMRRFIELR